MMNDLGYLEQSLLRQRIQRLSTDEQLYLSLRTETLFNHLMAFESDAELHNDPTDAGKKEPPPSQQYSPVELVVGVVNDYHTLQKSPEVIANERGLEVLQVMKALCSYLFQQPKTLIQGVDLTRANQFFCVEPCVVAELVDLLLRMDLTSLLPLDLCTRLVIMPSYCLLALTLIWLELKCPRLASLVEGGWARITYPTFSPEQYEVANKQLETLLVELAEERTVQRGEEHGAGDEQKSMDEKLAKELGLLQGLMEERREGLHQLVDSVKELDDKMHKRPNLKVETILSDSFDSDCEPPEPSAEEEFCIKMQRISAKWLGQELDEQLLIEELNFTAGDFCFARFGAEVKKDTATRSPPNACCGSFIMCRVIEIGNGSMTGLLKVQCASSSSASMKQGPISTVMLRDAAIGHAPSVRCPEGTRVIALHHRLARGTDGALHKTAVKEACWLPGTIGVRPVTANDFKYLVFFDELGVEDGYVDPSNVRLMLEQAMDSESGRFEPRYAFKLVEAVNAKKAAFLRDYLRTYPDWPLVRLKKSSNTMRVLARRGNHQESAFVLDVDRQMCLLRFPGTAKTSFYDKGGRDCVSVECQEHSHVDEWVYRGDVSRLPTLQSQIPKQQGLGLIGVGGCSNTRSGPTAASIRHIRESRSNRMHYEPAFTDFADLGDEEVLGTGDYLSTPVAALIASTSRDAGTMQQTARKTSRRLLAGTELPDAIPAGVPTFHSSSAAAYLSRQKAANAYRVDELRAPDWLSTPTQEHEKCSSQCAHMLAGTSEVERPEFANSSPFFKPLLMGWTRMVYTIRMGKGRGVNCTRKVVYRAPCGIRLSCIEDVADYLIATAPNPFSQLLTIDLFTFDETVNPGRLARPASANSVLMADFGKGEEDVSTAVVNAVDSQPPPRMEYRRWRYSDSAEIEKAMESGFCSGCTCTDNCADATRCECQQLTIQSNDRLSKSLRASNAQTKTYQYRTLQEKIISGIYECNGTCACSRSHCFNRVVQHRIKVPIELYMTAEIGWGVRTLVDLPAGYFIGTYSGKLLTNEMADRAGIESDAYFAELDLVDVVEVEKRQQGIDLIGGNGGGSGDYEDEGLGLDSEGDPPQPSTTALQVPQLRADSNDEPSALEDELDAYNEALQQRGEHSGGRDNDTGIAPFKFEDYFGDNALFIVDAQQAGNIGRFLNHSCEPNVFVQMVMVDTHDLRLPWIGFFTECAVKAGEELRWNYGYSPGSVPGKELICKCRTSSCQGRLL